MLDRSAARRSLTGATPSSGWPRPDHLARVAPVPTRHRRTSREGSGRTRRPPEAGRSARSGPRPPFCGRSGTTPAWNTLPPDAACGVRWKGVLFAGPRSPSFRRFVTRGTIATVASRTAQLLRLLVPSPHRLARVRRIGEIRAAALAGVAPGTCRTARGGNRSRHSLPASRSPVRPDRTDARKHR